MVIIDSSINYGDFYITSGAQRPCTLCIDWTKSVLP